MLFGRKAEALGSVKMEDLQQPNLPSDTPTALPCSFLEKLPPELRIRIYEYLLVFSHRLVPYSREKGPKPARAALLFQRWGEPETVYHAVDTTIFRLNKEIYEEAADVFYNRNKFCVQFDYFCTCWNSNCILRLNEMRIKHFKIQGVNLDYHEEPTFWGRCKTCKIMLGILLIHTIC